MLISEQLSSLLSKARHEHKGLLCLAPELQLPRPLITHDSSGSTWCLREQSPGRASALEQK